MYIFYWTLKIINLVQTLRMEATCLYVLLTDSSYQGAYKYPINK